MDTGLSDKVVVVTGGGAGIGLATVRAFVAEGSRVAAVDLEPAAAGGVDDSTRVMTVTADLSVPDGPAAAMHEVREHFGTIDVLVNNVGVAPHRDGFLSITDEDWRQLLEINFFSMIRACRAVLPDMVAQGHGAIVSVASDAGRIPGSLFIDYSVTKAAILMLAKAIANEYASKGVRSNCVSPGPTRTPVWEHGPVVEALAAEFDGDHEAAIDNFLRNVRGMPMARLGDPEDVAAAIVFLASNLAKQVTGSDYRVDGGQIPTV
jgi:NAD(P)-dependent dehydrogenase (short-subunit alcohol dehydrogenase family)